LTAISTSSLVKAIEANINAQVPQMYAHMPRVRVFEEPDLLGTMTDLPDTMLNAVYYVACAPEQVETTIEQVLHRYRSQQCVPMAWVVSPLTQPGDLGKHLQARGFTHAFRTTGMAADLLGVETPTLPPAGLVIERVRTLEQLRQWLHPVAVSFDLVPEVAATFFELFARYGLGPHVPWQLFVGLADGKPVAASRLFCAAGVAGIYHVATVPEARGRGFGTAMTVTAIHAARELGYRIGVLAASSAGFNVYRRLGFQTCCYAEVYVWPGEDAQAR